ncbi:MAG TPA: CDP-2,3-bis-(O-geranylgeranyl)-sn-glycerol synthase [Candidatus Acidoferrum sp.]|nr:CDP-2,3-bis-(O-geranylgeranyl)-sn-glycerol synthase [Candidatus Acidoferrum sp.]
MYNLLYAIILYPIIYIFPAYAANGAPVIFGGGKLPLDLHKKISGKRIFGDNKTVKGTIASLVCGVAVGLIYYPFLHYMLPIAILLTIGANFGDLLGSFIKRRVGIASGRPIPLLDQYGFFVFALIFAAPLGYLPDVYGIVFLIVLTGILHLLTNMGAHKMRLKKVPW